MVEGRTRDLAMFNLAIDSDTVSRVRVPKRAPVISAACTSKRKSESHALINRMASAIVRYLIRAASTRLNGFICGRISVPLTAKTGFESRPSPTCSSITKPLLLGAPPTLGYRSPIEFKKLVSTEPATVQHLCAWGRSDLLDVLGPALKSLSHLRFIFRAIVDPRDASTVTAHVI